MARKRGPETKNNAPPSWRAVGSPLGNEASLDRAYVCSLEPLRPGLELEFDLLVGFELLEPLPLDGREVHEDILAARESITLDRMEPLHGAMKTIGHDL